MFDDKTIEKIIADREKKKKAQEAQAQFNEKELQDLKDSMEIICRRPEGIIFARAFMMLSGLYKLNKNNNNLYEIGVERGKEQLYLFLIKGLLPDDLISEIESKPKNKKE